MEAKLQINEDDLLPIVERMVTKILAEREAKQAPPDDDEVLTVAQVAKMKRVSRRTVYDWIAQGKIAHHKTPGGQLRFYRRHVESNVAPV